MLAILAAACCASIGLAQPAWAQHVRHGVEAGARGDRILGTWLVDAGDERVRVRVTRSGGGYDARIVWLETPVFPDDDPEGRGGMTKLDWHNPDADLRRRPILGLTLVQAIEYDARRDRWGEGRIYAPDQGRTYRCTMRLQSDGILAVRGYFKIGFIKIGRTMEWIRVE